MPAAMKIKRREMDFAIEVFVRGHSVGKSRTYPYEANRVGPLWVMRDAPRKNPRDYRKEEWIAHDVDAAEVDAAARRHTRGRFFVCAMVADGESDEPIRTAYKRLGYRLLATEGFFMQRLRRIPKSPSPVAIERMRTPELAARLGTVTRTRPIPESLLGNVAPFRQYVALDGEDIVGRVRAVNAAGAKWCAEMYVNASHGRRGIGQALLGRMLRDDRARSSKCSVLTASHTGALLYPRLAMSALGRSSCSCLGGKRAHRTAGCGSAPSWAPLHQATLETVDAGRRGGPRPIHSQDELRECSRACC